MNFNIKSGKHYSDNFLYKTLNLINTKKTLSYIVSFSENCKYQLPKEDQADINKLFGFSYGLNHHQNSARFGWCWNNNRMEIYSYVYESGERKWKYLSHVELEEQCKMSITDQEESWVFTINQDWGSPIETTISKKCKFTWGIKLWPFFGGNNPAPHDMDIEMIYWD